MLYMWMGLGWMDGMVIIGHRCSKGTLVLKIPKTQQQRETNIPKETAKTLIKERLLGPINCFDRQSIVHGFLKIAMPVPCPNTICFHKLL